MKFLSSNFSHIFFTLHDLFAVVNKFASDQKYVVIKKRIKNNKKEVFRKDVFACDKDENLKSQEFQKRKTSNRACECLFEVVVTLNTESDN